MLVFLVESLLVIISETNAYRIYVCSIQYQHNQCSYQQFKLHTEPFYEVYCIYEALNICTNNIDCTITIYSLS